MKIVVAFMVLMSVVAASAQVQVYENLSIKGATKIVKAIPKVPPQKVR